MKVSLGKVVILEGIPGAPSARDRQAGFLAITDQFPIEVLASITAYYSRERGATAMEDLLQAHPEINVMLPNNDPAAYGVIAAVEGAGLGVNKDVYIGCVGDQFKTLDLIEEGKIFSSVSVSPERTGEIMVEVAIDLFNGKEVPLNVYIPHKPITKDNVIEVRDYKLSFGPME